LERLRRPQQRHRERGRPARRGGRRRRHFREHDGARGPRDGERRLELVLQPEPGDLPQADQPQQRQERRGPDRREGPRQRAPAGGEEKPGTEAASHGSGKGHSGSGACSGFKAAGEARQEDCEEKCAVNNEVGAREKLWGQEAKISFYQLEEAVSQHGTSCRYEGDAITNN
ncbi:unnamed protein product, partial [Heterosigma akashiwo]